MGLLFVERLAGEGVFKCRRCRVDAASKDAVISKDFYGRSGRAYLFDHVVNICLGPNEDRHLITGLHTVNDIYCSCCQQILGWRYEKAYDESQRSRQRGFPVSVCTALLPARPSPEERHRHRVQPFPAQRFAYPRGSSSPATRPPSNFAYLIPTKSYIYALVSHSSLPPKKERTNKHLITITEIHRSSI